MLNNDSKHLLLNYATRQRPDKFMKNLDAYLSKASGNHKITVVVSMDKDDLLCNNPHFRKFLDNKKSETVDIIYSYGESKGKIDAINRDVPATPWDILISTADDMDLYGSINYNTDPRLETKEDGRAEGWKGLITLPVIGRKLYDKFGYIYHPDYISESCDDEQTIVFTRLSVLKHIDRRPIFHNFKPWHDELMVRNMQIGQTVDRKKFLERKEKNFDMETV